MRFLSLLVVVVFMTIQPTAKTTVFGAILQVQDSSDVLQLNTLIAEALAKNASLRAVKLHAAEKRAVPLQASSLPNPVVGASFQPFPIYTARGFQRFQVSLEQDIPFPGKLGLSETIAEYSAVMAGYDIGIAERLIVYRVRASYYELYRIQEQISLIEQFRSQLSDLVTSTTTRYKVGEGLQQDILKAQLERNKLDEVERGLLQRQISEIETIGHLLNLRDRSNLLSKKYFVERQAESTIKDPRYLTGEQRPELLAQRVALEQSEADVRLSGKMFFPDFTVGIHYYDIGASGLTPTMTGRNALGIQLKVSVPLWRDGLTAKLNESRFKHQENDALLNDLEIQIFGQVRRAVNQLELENGTLKLYEKTLIPQAQTSLLAALNAYATGQTEFINLLDAERMLFSLRMSFLDSLSRALQYSAALDWALGNPPPDGGNGSTNGAPNNNN